MKSLFTQKEIRNTILSALVGAMVAIILVPISQTISFMLNEYLSRPILSIEYLEFLPEEHIQLDEFKNMCQSDEFNNYCVMKNMKTAINLMSLQSGKATLSLEEKSELNDALSKFKAELSSRILFLKTIQNNISSNKSEESIKKAYAKYHGAAAQYSMMMITTENMQTSLSSSLQVEKDALNIIDKTVSRIIESLNKNSNQIVGTLKIKVSVLNRGDTDGLIRNVALLRLSNSNISVSLKKITLPANELTLQSVPVTVVNPSEDSQRSTSVGKIERKSMTEIWYEIDKSKIYSKAINAFWTSLNSSRVSNYTVVLYDQKRDSVTSSVSWRMKKE